METSVKTRHCRWHKAFTPSTQILCHYGYHKACTPGAHILYRYRYHNGMYLFILYLTFFSNSSIDNMVFIGSWQESIYILAMSECDWLFFRIVLFIGFNVSFQHIQMLPTLQRLSPTILVTFIILITTSSDQDIVISADVANQYGWQKCLLL